MAHEHGKIKIGLTDSELQSELTQGVTRQIKKVMEKHKDTSEHFDQSIY